MFCTAEAIVFGTDLRREVMTAVAECFMRHEVPVKKKNYHAGTLIFSEGDTVSGMYFVESGVVRITRNVPEIGREISLALLGPGECFGIISCITGKPRTADARAVTDCSIWEMDKDTLREAVSKSPEFAQLMVQGLIKRLEELQTRMRETTEQMAEFARRMENLSTLWNSLITWG